MKRDSGSLLPRRQWDSSWDWKEARGAKRQHWRGLGRSRQGAQGARLRPGDSGLQGERRVGRLVSPEWQGERFRKPGREAGDVS